MTNPDRTTDSPQNAAEYAPTDIAVVGLSLRFPGASTADEFWSNLREGKESIVDLSDKDLITAGVDPELLDNPNYVKRAPLLRGVEWFDATFFGLNPNEASVMDPQHRLFLECGWHALEDAAYDPDTFNGPIGVFGGSGYNAYMTYHLARNPDLLKSMGFFLLRHTGNDKDFLTTRLSYCLNLTGPSINVQTACSTSLVAVHLATQSLANFECDMALAGGVTIELPLNHGYLYNPGEIYSPDGHCRAFDAESRGTVFGSGCGIIVLKRMEDALRDGDNIRAVIKGSAINNDGSGKAGYLAPSVEGQANAIVEALEFSALDPESVSYIETHGTGTAVGDPIEISALTTAYGSRTDKKQYCAIGSVKTNIGHLDTAAGVASIIKTILAMENREIPPSLHFKSPNSEIDFSATPFYVNASLKEWRVPDTQPLRAGVSSLGVGGTNAHVLLEEAPSRNPTSQSRDIQLILLSAQNEQSLQVNSDNLVEFLGKNDHSLADVAYTYQIGRHHFNKRRAIVCSSKTDLIERLDAEKHPLVINNEAKNIPPPVTFMFTGQGAQYIGMAKNLYLSETSFRNDFDQCADILLDYGYADLRQLIFESDPKVLQDVERINQTDYTQPALFTVEYCLSRLWMRWGIIPTAMIGHSIGEYVAACLAEVFSLEDALKLVALRGKLMQSASTGSMLAIPLSSQEVKPYLSDKVELAAINSSSLCVLSGSDDDIVALKETLDNSGTPGTILKTSHAFHSRFMDSILEEFEQALLNAKPQAPKKPFISNLTGNWITEEEATDPKYWSQHLRRPVLFAAGISRLLEDADRVFLEVGPGSVLTQFVKQHAKFINSNTIIESLGGIKSENSDHENILCALGRLWAVGVIPDWQAYYHDEQRWRISLPGYAFQRQRYWIERDQYTSPLVTDSEAPQTTGNSLGLEVNRVIWKALEAGQNATLPNKILLIGNKTESTTKLVQAIRQRNCQIITATLSDQFSHEQDDVFTVRPSSLEDYDRLFTYANEFGTELILHCINLDQEGELTNTEAIHNAFINPLLCSQAATILSNVTLGFLSKGAFAITGYESGHPLASLLSGPAMVTGLELPDLAAFSLDVDDDEPEQLLNGVSQALKQLDYRPPVFALRGEELLGKTFESVSPEETSVNDRQFDGCCLVTGGLSGLGLEVSRHLTHQKARKIAIIGKTRLPDQADWPSWLSTHASDDPITRRLRELQSLRNTGVDVRYYATDIQDQDALANCIKTVKDDFEAIKSIIHCAGTIDDGPLLTKDIENVLTVLAPKVLGTLGLLDAVADQELDEFVMFSSVSSLWGSPGQIDYVAANAFMDALVPVLQERISGRVLSVNWAAWAETGMTERLANPAIEAKAQVAHPLIDKCLYHSGQYAVYETEMSPNKHWVIHEHRAAGSDRPILPGTGFLEIVKAAFEPLVKETHVQFSDVMFLSPFVLTSDEARPLRIQFEPWSLGTLFSVISQSDPEDRDSWFIHMKGRIKHGPQDHKTLDIDTISKRCGKPENYTNEQSQFLKFGPRWENIESVRLGNEEALLQLSLPAEYRQDVDSIYSHPGMLDVATAGILKLVEGYEPNKHFYVPIAYNKIDFYRAMPDRWISHVVYKAGESQPGDVIVFDVTIADELGNVLAEFEDFMLKCIDGPDNLVRSRPPLSARINPLTTAHCLQPNELLRTRLQESGIEPDAGIKALDYFIDKQLTGQYAVSKTPITELLTSLVQSAEPVQQNRNKISEHLDLGLVEQLLDSHEAVKLSAVLAREDRFGELNIAAFVQLDPMLATTISELRRYVRREADEQLVPSKFIQVDQLPVDNDGKVNKNKLPDPFSNDEDFVAPSTDTEKMLSRIWQDILGVDQISITDNFFDLGGHSLLGVRLLAAIRKETGIRLEDVVVVTYTLEQISAELDKRMKSAG